jgi:radical SAM protein with 4Fe4S-binding SPASM domain
MKAELYNDSNKQLRFLLKADVYQKLAVLLGPKYIEYRRKWAEASLMKDILKYPLHLDVDISDMCNIDCHFCARHKCGERGALYKPVKDKLSLEVFGRIIEEGVPHGLAAISMSPIGEALMEDDICHYIRVAKNTGIMDAIIYTNGHLLTYEKSIDLIKAGVTWINISIGASTKGTYEAVRDHADFDRVIRNTLGLIKAKKDLKSDLPIVRVSFVCTKQSYHELEDFIEFWQDRADVISVQNLVRFGDLGEDNQEFKSKFYVETGYKTLKVCHQPFQRLQIRNNGNISPCCTFCGLDLVFGNIYQDKIYDVYNSKKMKDFKIKLNSQNRSEICEKCMEGWDL